MYKTCSGDWKQLSKVDGVDEEEVQAWLEYAATFLSNIGNYYVSQPWHYLSSDSLTTSKGSGDQKFTPRIVPDTLQKLASRSPKLSSLYAEFQSYIMAIPPFTLGYPSTLAQSSYYPGQLIGKDEIALVSKHLASHSIFPENTRLRKTGECTFEVLQASVELTEPVVSLDLPNSSSRVDLIRGDHADDLKVVCDNLSRAADYAANDTQRKFLAEYIESFGTGNLDVYRDSQRTWVTDKTPKVENIFGFVEPYRDPAGIRAEFEGLVAIADAEETKLLSKLVENSDRFIRRLPWASPENNGKGVFEKSLFEPPDLSSIHGE